MSKFVNMTQSPEERRAKYALCRYLGDDPGIAQRRRDIRWNKIARHHGYTSFKTMVDLLGLDLEYVVVNYYRKIGWDSASQEESEIED